MSQCGADLPWMLVPVIGGRPALLSPTRAIPRALVARAALPLSHLEVEQTMDKELGLKQCGGDDDDDNDDDDKREWFVSKGR